MGPCSGWVSGAAVAGGLQGWTLEEAAATREVLPQDLIDSACLTAWACCEKRANLSILCNYLLRSVITRNCLLFIECHKHGALLKLFCGSTVPCLSVLRL